MWSYKYIDEYDLGDIAFSEEFSFCVSTPDYDDIKLHKSLVACKSSPCIGDSLDKERRNSLPIKFIKNNRSSANSSLLSNPHKALIRTSSLGSQDRYCRKSPSVYDIHKAYLLIKSRISPGPQEQYSEKSLPELDPRKALIRKGNSLRTNEIILHLLKRNGSFGFTVAAFIGGFFVKTLTQQANLGKIRPGDRILEVNGKDIASLSLPGVIMYLRNIPGSVTLKICRRCSVWRFCAKHLLPEVQTFNVILEKCPNEELGFFVQESVENSDIRNFLLPSSAEVRTVCPGSLAHKNGMKARDRILEVNGESLLDKTADEVNDILQKTNGVLKMVFCRL